MATINLLCTHMLFTYFVKIYSWSWGDDYESLYVVLFGNYEEVAHSMYMSLQSFRDNYFRHWWVWYPWDHIITIVWDINGHSKVGTIYLADVQVWQFYDHHQCLLRRLVDHPWGFRCILAPLFTRGECFGGGEIDGSIELPLFVSLYAFEKFFGTYRGESFFIGMYCVGRD